MNTIVPIYDLATSPHIVDANGYKFVFSSASNAKKFMKRVQEMADTINHSLSTRWGFPVIENDLGVLLCYLKIEHRGCRILLPDGGEIRQWEELKYKDGNIVMNV